MLRNYTSTFSDTELDFLNFINVKMDGGKIPWPGYLHPHPLFLTDHTTC